jgi:hypothetical protein
MPKTSAVDCVLIAVFSFIAINQASASTENTASANASPSASAAPSPEMAALYPRIGKWSVIIRTEPGKDSPKGGVDHGVMTMTKGPGGFSVVQDFRSRGFSGDVIGESYEWWDERTKVYKFVWCDNISGCVQMDSVLTGNTWTNEIDSVDHGQKVHTVIRADMSADHNSIHEEARSSYDGGPYQVQTVGDYKRISAGTK